jgi:hypothetical protein
MNFLSAAVFLAAIRNGAAFSAVAPSSVGAAIGNPDPVDKSMRGIDKEPSTFDPTAGDSPALNRNNMDQVWVPQVRMCRSENGGLTCRSLTHQNQPLIHSCYREPAHVETGKMLP